MLRSTSVAQRVPHAEQELPTLPEHLRSLPVSSGVVLLGL